MQKTFRAILAEQDTEYTYHIKSTRHLHDDEIFYNLQLGLMGFGLRSLERMSYNPLKAVEPMFSPKNGAPGIDYVYHVKAVLSTDVPNGILRQKIAYFTDIHWEYLVVHRDGESLEQSVDVEPEEDGGTYRNLAHSALTFDGTPDEGDIDDNAQSYVGQGRIDAFLKELEAEKKEREEVVKARNVEPKLTESFITSHMALQDIIGGTRKGFYLVERRAHDDSVLHISGPFKKQPSNYPFVADLMMKGVGTFEVVNRETVRMVEHDNNFRFTARITEQDVPKPYEVTVKDQDTGKTYDVLVKAVSETAARELGVRRVARQERLEPTKLIAVEPEPAHV